MVLGSIIAAIITTHIVQVSTKSLADHACRVIELIEPTDAMEAAVMASPRSARYDQASAVTASRAAATMTWSRDGWRRQSNVGLMVRLVPRFMPARGPGARSRHPGSCRAG